MRRLSHAVVLLSLAGLAACASPDPATIARASSGLTPATSEAPMMAMMPAPAALAVSKGEPPSPAQAPVAAPDRNGAELIQIGRATWYGKKFHGRKTASGEVYNMEGLTAAHADLPLGTWIQVTNLDNGRSLRLKVNDRLPAKQAILDVSARAARDLGFHYAGAAEVKIEADTNLASADD